MPEARQQRPNLSADTYSLALANASRFGSWKNDTQRLVIDLGSETWEFLSPQAKREFILNIERGLHRHPHSTLRIVRDYGAWPKICMASSGVSDVTLPHLQTLCAQEPLAELNDPSHIRHGDLAN